MFPFSPKAAIHHIVMAVSIIVVSLRIPIEEPLVLLREVLLAPFKEILWVEIGIKLWVPAILRCCTWAFRGRFRRKLLEEFHGHEFHTVRLGHDR